MRTRIPANKRGIIDQVFVHHEAVTKYSSTGALILGLLCYSIAKFGAATHSRSTVGRRIRCERRTSQRLIAKMLADEWLVCVDAKNASGMGFAYGDKMPEHVKRSYASLVRKGKKKSEDGFLISVDISAFKTLSPQAINRKKANFLRKMAYVRGVIAYRSASNARRNNGFFRAKYKNVTALANHLNVCLKTAAKYLRILKEEKLARVSHDQGLCIDPHGALLGSAEARYQFLLNATLQMSYGYDPNFY